MVRHLARRPQDPRDGRQELEDGALSFPPSFLSLFSSFSLRLSSFQTLTLLAPMFSHLPVAIVLNPTPLPPPAAWERLHPSCSRPAPPPFLRLHCCWRSAVPYLSLSPHFPACFRPIYLLVLLFLLSPLASFREQDAFRFSRLALPFFFTPGVFLFIVNVS